MVEYLPVGSQEAPQTIVGKKKFQPQTPKSHSQPSVHCKEEYHQHDYHPDGRRWNQSKFYEGQILSSVTIDGSSKFTCKFQGASAALFWQTKKGCLNQKTQKIVR